MQIDTDRRLIIETVTGRVTPMALIESFQQLLDHPDFESAMSVIWDLRGTWVRHCAVDFVARIPDRLKAFMAQRGSGYRIALVGADEQDLHLLRLYRVPLTRLQATARAFDDLDSAIAWAEQGSA